jgi:hypothetical protein
MANPEHLTMLKEGVAAWNLWREKYPGIRPRLSGTDLGATDLSKANLSGADLNRASLSKANLREANLREASLVHAILFEADLGEANLSGANLFAVNLSRASLRKASLNESTLREADLTMANLREANLRKADLGGVDLDWASLDGADFTAATVVSTRFSNVDLSGVTGLATVRHRGPSRIGIDTIYKSKGKIPHVFLRGAGVPENFIEYMASLVGTGIEFYSLFISYSTKDQKFADRIYADLQAKGVRCWFAPHELLGGMKTYRQIDEAIRLYDKLLLILSPASMGSEWVRTEIAIARKREKEQNRDVLFPIALCPFKRIKQWEYFDSDIGKDSAREIREYHIPNFTKWKTDQDAYQKEFAKLLKALQDKADGTPA